MLLIDHPDRFTEGTRVLLLKGRHKDGVETQRCIMRVTHDSTAFRRTINDLLSQAAPGERIYASAGARDVTKAVRFFKARQLANDYAADPLDFYRHIEARWISCLMEPTAQADKIWLFDCDDQAAIDDTDEAIFTLKESGHIGPDASWFYRTKNGGHFLVLPFNRDLLPESVAARLHTNPIMLWGY